MLNVQGLASTQIIRTRVADGDRGTAQTIPYAKQLIQEGMVDPGVRLLAVQYCAGVPPNDDLGEMNAIFNGLLRDFRYIKDPVGTQLLQPASGVLQTRAGNCATLNLVLLPSLLGSVGYPSRAVTIKADMDRPKEYSHVYIEAQTSEGQWIPMDVARSNPVFGKEPEYYWARRNWPLTSGQPVGASFLKGYGGLAMNRGMGAQTAVVVKRRGFPRGMASFFSHPVPAPLPAAGGPIRCGMGQGDQLTPDQFYQQTGITLDDYNSDQAVTNYSSSPTPAYAPSSSSANYTAVLAAATPAILGGVAQVVKASNTPNIAYSGVGLPNTTSGFSGSGGSILILLVVAGVAVFAFSHKG